MTKSMQIREERAPYCKLIGAQPKEEKIVAWYDDLLKDQRTAAVHAGSHARLLAGPGTGKTFTLTRHMCFLIAEKQVPADRILAITFTRAAARELRQRIASELGEEENPRIFTLHAFALRQLLKNATIITALPQPLRIADDWEERNIVHEDLKSMLGLARIKDARDLLSELSADWQSLTADEADWEKRHPVPRFLGAWREHRQVYGYTLRSELVYQLKKALEQRGDFELEGPIGHLLVDEYQDLNRCDLAVVQQIASRGVELFIAGDDDQSIYGFRKAHPEGIRRFPRDYSGATEIELEVCKRCDRAILDIGLFVARQDPRRIEKRIRSEPGTEEGEVALLHFDNDDAEARGITDLCTRLTERCNLKPHDILILLRADRNGVFSRMIREQLQVASIGVAAATDTTNPLDEVSGRALLAFLELAVRQDSNLAWHSLLQIWCDGIGPRAVNAVYDLARSRSESFAQTAIAAHADTAILPTKHRSRLSNAIGKVVRQLEILFPEDTRSDHETCDELMEVIRSAANSIVADDGEREAILLKFEHAVEEYGVTSIETLVRAIRVESENIEQELAEGKVNILTMHRAKGLTAEAVIIAAAEDEYIPGRALGEEIDDERRLLYVSLTRAKHYLFVSYCDRRTGQQRYTGRHSGSVARTLSRFLVDCPHSPQDGETFISDFGIGNCS